MRGRVAIWGDAGDDAAGGEEWSEIGREKLGGDRGWETCERLEWRVRGWLVSGVEGVGGERGGGMVGGVSGVSGLCGGGMRYIKGSWPYLKGREKAMC